MSALTRSLTVAALLGCGGTKDTAAQPAVVDSGVEDVADVRVAQPGDPPVCASEPAVTMPPAPRGDHGGALDAADRKLVLFGGDTDVAPCGGIPARKHSAETFVLDVACGSYRPIMGANPGARARHVMVSDVERDRAVMFSGRTRSGSTGPYQLFNDAWAFDFKTEAWSVLATTGTAPSPRANAAGAIDRKRSRLIVFGGNTNTAGTAFTPTDDTFALDLKTGAWTAIASATRPTARLFHAMAVDDDGEQLYLFGGGDENAFTGPFFKDTWALDLKTDTWKKLAPSGQIPLGRIQLGMSFDRDRKRVLVFGGHDDGKLGNENDLYALNVATMQWTKLGVGDSFKSASTGTCKFPADFTEIDKNAPERRSAFAFAPTSDGRAFVVHGGKSDCGLLTDVHWWNDVGETFTPITKAPAGLSCLRYSETCTSLCG